MTIPHRIGYIMVNTKTTTLSISRKTGETGAFINHVDMAGGGGVYQMSILLLKSY